MIAVILAFGIMKDFMDLVLTHATQSTLAKKLFNKRSIPYAGIPLKNTHQNFFRIQVGVTPVCSLRCPTGIIAVGNL